MIQAADGAVVAPVTDAAAPRGTTWAWIGWTFVPWLNWVGWIHAGVRTKRAGYVLLGTIYAAPTVLMGLVGQPAPDRILNVAVIAWIVGIAHALLVRKRIAARIDLSARDRRWTALAWTLALIVLGLPPLARDLWPERIAALGLPKAPDRPRDMPTARMSAAGALAGGRVYVAGGVDSSGGYSDVVEAYDPAANDWQAVAAMPAPRAMAAAVSDANELIVFGGRNSSGPLNGVDTFDTVTGRWTSLPPLPTPRWGHSAAAIGERAYVVGGIDGVGGARRALADVDVFDLRARQWSTAAPLPSGRHGAALAVIGDKLYILGGRVGAGDAGTATSAVLMFDPGSGTYTSVRPLSRARTGAQAAVLGTRIYIVGGGADGLATDSIEIYDTASNTSTEARLSTARTGHVVAASGERLIVIGGAERESLRAILKRVEFIGPERQP